MFSQVPDVVNYNGSDSWGRKHGLSLYCYNGNAPKTDYQIIDHSNGKNFNIILTCKNKKLWFIFTKSRRNKLKVKVERLSDTYAHVKPPKSSYYYEFNDNGTLSKEGLYLWYDDPELDDSDYYDELIMYDSLGRYTGIMKETYFGLSPGLFYPREELQDTNLFRMPQMYGKERYLVTQYMSDSTIAIFYHTKNGKRDGYYRHFNKNLNTYSLIGEYEKDTPTGIWLFFNKETGKLSAVIYNISKNRTVKVLNNGKDGYKFKYKGYMFCIDNEAHLKSERWILFDDLTDLSPSP